MKLGLAGITTLRFQCDSNTAKYKMQGVVRQANVCCYEAVQAELQHWPILVVPLSVRPSVPYTGSITQKPKKYTENHYQLIAFPFVLTQKSSADFVSALEKPAHRLTVGN